jgi:hypothetical protein
MNDPVATPAHPAGRAWFTTGRFAGVLAAFCLVAFWKVLLGGEAMFYRDYGFLGYPFIFFSRESFWQGELPFWNPYVNCGAPFLAQWNTLALYPGSLIYWLLPLPWSLGFFCIVHVFLAGLGMYFLAHRWTGDRDGAAVAGTGFAFSGLMLASLIYPNYLVTLGWMPWVVLAVERGWREGGRWLVWGALTGALQMLTGAPEILLLTWLLLLVMAAGHAWEGQGGAGLRGMGRFAGMVVLVAGLTAVQLLPFFDLLAHSQRSSGFAGGFWSMPSGGWANLVAPMFHYAKTPQGTYVQAGQSFFPSYYLGVGVLFLALLAVALSRRKRIVFLAGAAVFSLCLALGQHGVLYGLVKQVVPVIGFARYPIKFVALAAFALPLLAAFGIALMREAGEAGRGQELRVFGVVAVVFLALMGVVGWQGYAQPLPTDNPRMFLANLGVRALIFAGLACLLHGYFTRGSWRARVTPAVVALLFVDTLTGLPGQVPVITSQAFEPGMIAADLKLSPAPKLGESRVMLSSQAEFALHRQMLPDFLTDFLVERKALWYNLNILDGIPKINGASTLQPREQLEVENLIYGTTNDVPRLADFLGAAHVTVPGETTKWQARSTHRPWITAGQRPIFAEAGETLRALSAADFEPAQVVYLPAEARGQVAVTNGTEARVSGVDFRARQVTFDVEARQAAVAVIAQTYYHPWQATVAGKQVPLWRANHGFQALEVPAGKSRVELSYQDRRFRTGGMVTLLSLGVCGWLWRRERKAGA